MSGYGPMYGHSSVPVQYPNSYSWSPPPPKPTVYDAQRGDPGIHGVTRHKLLNGITYLFHYKPSAYEPVKSGRWLVVHPEGKIEVINKKPTFGGKTRSKRKTRKAHRKTRRGKTRR